MSLLEAPDSAAPIVISQSRRPAVILIVVAALFCGVAVAQILRAGSTGYLVMLVAGVSAFAFALWRILDPGRYILTSAGLSEITVFGRRAWAWNAIRRFDSVRPVGRRTTRIAVERMDGGSDTLAALVTPPGAPPALAALNQALERWRTAA